MMTDHEIAEAMIACGGGFVSRLGHLWLVADPTNRARLKAAFPEYWETYATRVKWLRTKKRRTHA